MVYGKASRYNKYNFDILFSKLYVFFFVHARIEQQYIFFLIHRGWHMNVCLTVPQHFFFYLIDTNQTMCIYSKYMMNLVQWHSKSAPPPPPTDDMGCNDMGCHHVLHSASAFTFSTNELIFITHLSFFIYHTFSFFIYIVKCTFFMSQIVFI